NRSQDHHRRDEVGHARGFDAHPERRVRAGVHHREPRRRADAALQSPADGAASDRAGGRETALDDALDQEEQAGRPDPQLRSRPVPTLRNQGGWAGLLALVVVVLIIGLLASGQLKQYLYLSGLAPAKPGESKLLEREVDARSSSGDQG